ncbi:MAG: double zinc ribbon domain-containing protein [Methanobacterium sp.]
MSSFFDKVKQGVNETGKQAKIAVESNRLKMQINVKQKEMDGIFLEIGKIVYQAYKNNYLSSINEQLNLKYEAIMSLEREIENINKAIVELKDTKYCQCGAAVDNNARFCPKCGCNMDVMNVVQNQFDGNSKQCVCGNVLPVDAKFCTACGNKFDPVYPVNEAAAPDAANTKQCSCENIMPIEAKFCTACGKNFETLDEAPSQAAENTIQCSCGNTMPLEARFCTACGSKF